MKIKIGKALKGGLKDVGRGAKMATKVTVNPVGSAIAGMVGAARALGRRAGSRSVIRGAAKGASAGGLGGAAKAGVSRVKRRKY